MAFQYTVTRTTGLNCPYSLYIDLNNDPTFAPYVCNYVVVRNDIDVIIDFQNQLSATDESSLITYVQNYTCPTGAIDGTGDTGSDPDDPGGTISDPIGSLITLTFTKNGEVEDKWLEIGDGVYSYKTPTPLPFKCKIHSLSFSNRRNSSTDLQLRIATNGNGNSFTTVDTLQLRNVRTYWANMFNKNIILNPGDKLGIYCKEVNNSDEPKDVAVIVFLQVQGTPDDGNESF